MRTLSRDKDWIGKVIGIKVTIVKPRKKRARPKTPAERLWPLTWMGIEPPNLSLRNLVMEVELL